MSVQLTQAGLKYMRAPGGSGKHPRLETKPTYVKRETFVEGERTAITNTGGGYEHFRTTVDGVEVYASHHRLLAIAWNTKHAETGEPLLGEDELEGVIDTSVLSGVDVHHSAPELTDGEYNKTFGWDNREDCLSHVEHGRHSGMTNAQKRAYARDGQRLRDGVETLTDGPGCEVCGEPPKAAVRDSEYCLEHASEFAKKTDDPVVML